MTPSDAMQIDFARLSGDAVARARFANDPEAESAALAALAPRAVDGFARGILAKRYHEVRRLLPRSARMRDFSARFAAYAARRPVGGLDRHRHDAIAFARALGTPLARMEGLALEAASGEAFARIALWQGLCWWFRGRRGGRLRSGVLGTSAREGRPPARD